MTKCHPLLVCAILTLLSACKPAQTGPSLSEYGARSQTVQFARFEQYAREIDGLPLEEALRRQAETLAEAEQDSARWQQQIVLQEHFFFDPNSPYRNEELYLPAILRQMDSPFSTEDQRNRARWAEPRLRLNRPGTEAADIPFTLRNGRTVSLHDVIDSRHPHRTLLFFSNPGCPNCKEITDDLERDLRIQQQIDEGTLLVINIYPDEGLQAWFDYLPNYPKEWICGYDPDQLLSSGTRYWLRAIPSLYLLDEQKRVLFKDAPLEKIITALLAR